MTDLYGHNLDINYENFVTQCPYSDCKNVNIFNRASDLETFKYIDCKEVECFKCKQKFNIKSDYVGEKHEYLIYDCYELLKQKRYMYCIINLCIACEAFFFKGIEIKLLWKPWKEKIFERDTEMFNRFSHKLYKKTQDYTYSKLLNVFFDLYLKNKPFVSLTSIEDYINKMDCFVETTPKDKDVRKFHDPKTAVLLMNLKKLKINEIRNDVAHKYAVRPSRQSAVKYLEEVRSVIFNLEARLKVKRVIEYCN